MGMLDIWLVREIRVSQVYPFREMRMKIGEYRAQFDWWIAFLFLRYASVVFAICFWKNISQVMEKHSIKVMTSLQPAVFLSIGTAG